MAAPATVAAPSCSPPSHRQRLEGVIGYFGGGAPSRTIPVVMRIE